MFWWFLTLMVIWMGFHVYFVESMRSAFDGSHYEHHPSQQNPSWMTFRQTWRSKFVFFWDFYSGFHRDFSNEYDGRFIGKIHGIFPGDVISSATFGNQGRGWWWWRRWHFNEGSAGSVYFRVKIWFTMGRLLAMKCHPASSSFGSDEDPGDGRNAVMAVWFNVYYDTYLPVIGWCIV